MFKLESIVTPLLLSYVEKYVKNIAVKDSQVSLWGGEGVFNNLDLRLDVLEQELQLPFTFVNGHVHELRINVPWTKLGSEPITVTVNTFECILKLKDGTETDSAETESSGSDESRQKRKPQRLEVEEAPPSYVHSLITRILSNMNIICNNVILKYVEDDIVLSINVKSAQLHTANSDWERAYVDTLQTDLIVRKLISLIDVTICLDQRNASGKIDTYQDPLLYRSVIDGRAYIAYDSPTSRSPSVSRFDFKSEEMELSVTDQQLPMLLRLAQLCMALYFGDLVLVPPKVTTDFENDVAKSLSESMEEEQTWGSWAWSLVPQLNTIWEDDVTGDDTFGPQAPNPVFHFAAFLHKATVTIKLTETSSKTQKVTLRPLACLTAEGLFINAAVRHPDWANIQVGVSAGQVVSVGECVCVGSFAPDFVEPVLAAGGQLGTTDRHYFDQSLFNEASPENQKQRRDYSYDWEEHFKVLSETKLLECSPTFSLDYFYHVVLPEDLSDLDSTNSFTDLEDSNLKERLMVRCLIGPCEFNVTANFAHRLEKFIRSAFNREFEPYKNSTEVIIQRNEKHSTPSTEDAIKLEEFIPFKCYSLSIIQPKLRLFASNHPSCDVMATSVSRKKSKISTSERAESSTVTQPVIIIEASRLEMQQIVPMYPKKIVKIAVNMHPLSDHFLYNSQSHVTAKAFNVEFCLGTLSNGQFDSNLNFIPSFSGAIYLKELQHPDLWKNPFQPKTELLLETSRFCFRVTWPQVLLISSILNSWYKPCVEKTRFIYTNLPQDSLSTTNEYSTIEFSANAFECKYSQNDAVRSAIIHLSSCYSTFQYWVNHKPQQVLIFHGPEGNDAIHSVDFFTSPIPEQNQDLPQQFVKIVVQFPIDMNSSSAPTLFLLSVKGISVYLDPAIFEWIDYFPDLNLNSVVRVESPRKEEAVESKASAPSSTVPTESQSFLKSESDKFIIPKEMIQQFLQTFSILKRLLIEVNCETCTIFVPTTTAVLATNFTDIRHGLQRLFYSSATPDMLVVNLPKVLLHSGSQKQNLFMLVEDIPIYTLEGLNLSQDLFPWTLSLTNFSVYTLNSAREALYCVNCLSLSATVALNTESDSCAKLSKINVCVHADNDLIHVQMSDKQVVILADIAQNALDAAAKLLSRATSFVVLFGLTTEDTTFSLFNTSGDKATLSQVESSSLGIQSVKDDIQHLFADLPKLTLWVQWTLPKLTVDLLSINGTCLNLEFDELGLSLDIQEVYSKLKFKLTTFNWNHYQKDNTLNKYVPGPFKGIVFTCTDKLCRNISIPNPKADSFDTSIDDIEIELSSKSKYTYNFLTVNLTRALSKNVQRRWTQLLREHEPKPIDSYQISNRYVSEIDVKIRSFDCVLFFPVLTTCFRIFEPFFYLKFENFNEPLKFTMKVAADTMIQPQGYQFQMLNNNTLPLLYLHISAIRVFIPKNQQDDSRSDDDMLVFQVGKISIASQVDNPLSRIVLRSDILALAQQARIINVPGSDVEDRQYQMDIAVISLSTGSWGELVKRSHVSESPSVGTQLHTMGENPALEWNNKLTKPSDTESEVVFLPLISDFNIRILAAPAIVYKQLKEDILVAGHSFEVNLTSDIDVYISLKQLGLVYEICEKNILTILDVIHEPLRRMHKPKAHPNYESGPSNWMSEQPDSGIEIRLESGTESEPSIFHQNSIQRSNPLLSIGPTAKVIIQQQILNNKWWNERSQWNPFAVVPFEILFTARGFSVMAYCDTLTLKESMLKKEELDNIGLKEPEDSNEDSLIPIVYLTFSQPHAFVRCRHAESKLDISCFDFVLKGSNDKVVQLKRDIPLPCVEDYTVNWVETRPGDVNERTGISPSLITASIKNFLKGSADVKVQLSRPIRVNMSLSKYEQVLRYIEVTLNVTRQQTDSVLATSEISSKDLFSADANSLRHQSSSINEIVAKLRYFGTFLRHVHLSTVQFVIVLESIPHEESAHAIVSWDGVRVNIILEGEKNSMIDELALQLYSENFSVKTSYNSRLRILLDPCCPTINCQAVWDFWNKSGAIPRLCINAEFETMSIFIGRETWLCYKKLEKHLTKYFKHTKTTPAVRKREKSKTQLELNEQTWHDDLRVGRFQYIQDADDTGVQPYPYEIVFCKGHLDQPASMTWCYPEPRVLTRAEIYPVPFRTASDASTQFETNEEVMCVLQYWDNLTRSYITCQQFHLSESQHCNLNLPRIVLADTKQHLFTSNRWRVVLDYFDPTDESEEHISRRNLVSPLALAACMRVDSYFNPKLIQVIQTRLAIESLKMNLVNHLQPPSGETPALSTFVFDGTMPLDQGVLTLLFQNSVMTTNSWETWHKLELNTTSSSDILEYRTLTYRPFIEQVRFQMQIIYAPEQKPSLTDITIKAEPTFIFVGQNVIHTLSFAAYIFQQPPEDSCIDQLFLTHYVICNDTQETIRFGQVDTDENIVLRSRQMHAYSWRTHKNKQLLHLCVEGMKWKWCEPFGIDKFGVEIRVVEQKVQRVTLFIKIKKVNHMFKQITICGQTVFANRLNKPFEIKMTPVFKYSDEMSLGGEKIFTLEKQSSAATFLSEPGTRRAFRIRCLNEAWSEEIHFPQKSLFTDTTLVKVPINNGQVFNLWCHFFTQKIGSSCQILVLLVPLYIIRTHLPCSINLLLSTPSLNQSLSVEIDGWGNEHQLHCKGPSDLTHQLAFKLEPEAEMSQPFLPISTNMISQVSKLPYPRSISVEEMSTSGMSVNALLWPYNDKDYEKSLQKLPPEVSEWIMKSQEKKPRLKHPATLKPNIELEVSLVQRWPACNALLIDVKPWGLIINKSTIDLVIVTEQSEDWKIESGEAFACPKIKEFMKLGMMHDNEVHYSDPLQISSDDWSLRRYWPNVINSIPLKGFLRCDVKIKKGTKSMLCCLTMTTKIRHGIRLFTVQPAYNVVNNTDLSLRVASFTVPGTEKKYDFQPSDISNCHLKSKKETGRNIIIPLLFWETFQPDVIYYATPEEHIVYISFSNLSESDDVENWSLPCRINTKDSNSRQCFALPTSKDNSTFSCGLPVTTKPMILTSHELDKITYLILRNDKTPQLLLHNQCSIPLYYGQYTQHSSDGIQIVEQTELVKIFPVVSAMTACHYTLPQLCKRYPELYDKDNVPKLHLASSCVEKEEYNEENYLIWSRGVDITSEGDLFLNIPNYGDVKIHLERVAHSMYLFVEPVSRVEVSAKEIRGRIELGEHVKTVHAVPKIPVKQINLLKENEENGSNKKNGTDSKVATTSTRPPKIDPFFYLNIHYKQFCLICLNDSSLTAQATELIRITADNLLVVMRDKVDILPSTKRIRTRTGQIMFLYAGQIQVDNQMFGQAKYDYPVVLSPQNTWQENFDFAIPFEIILQSMKKNAFFKFELTREKNPESQILCMDTMYGAMNPVAIYLEDSFLFKIYSVFSRYTSQPGINRKYRNIGPREGKLSRRFIVLSSVYASPFQTHTLLMEPLHILISIHSSIKLDISLVEVPLTFNKFERKHIVSTVDKVTNAMLIHYVSGAIFKAGWVVGSVDLIGNPGGFARAVGSGFADFLRLPYEGFFSGPWAFLSGVAYGTSALFRQFSAGSLFSLTTWASSVSRNMERISLDEEYHLQNEEARRQKPDSLTQGLTQGLSGFGISLLGAIAGIVDQPIQSIQKVVDQKGFPPAAAVTGIMSGVGKGLVGVVAKPVAGAAELIAQAGQGFLHGTGWSKILSQKFEAVTEFVQISGNSRLKYEWKMLSSLPGTYVVCTVEAMQCNQAGRYVPCVLLLTSQLLFVVNPEEDTQQQAFALIELECHGPCEDPTLIYMATIQKSNKPVKNENRAEDRVVDFVSKSTTYATESYFGNSVDSESQSDSSSITFLESSDNLTHGLKFYVSPPLRNNFVALFKTAKRNIFGKGFVF